MANTRNQLLVVTVLAGMLLAAPLQGQLARFDSSSNSLAAEASTSKTPPRRVIPNPAETLKPPSLSLSPAVVTTKGSFGQSITQTLLLNNGTARDMAFDMVAEDVVSRDGRRVFVPAGELKGSIASTAVFSTPMVVVKPFSTATVDVRFTMPAGSDIRAVVAMFRGKSAQIQGTVVPEEAKE